MKKIHENCIKTLENITPQKVSFSNITISPLSNLAEDFIVKESELPLKEDFIQWASLYNSPENNKYGNRKYIDFTTSPLTREDIPSKIHWSDIVVYIDKEPWRNDSIDKFPYI